MPQQDDPLSWDASAVASWLETTFSLEQSVIESFIENEVNGRVLLGHVDHQVLKEEFGISTFGKRCMVLEGINKLRVAVASRQKQQRTDGGLLDLQGLSHSSTLAPPVSDFYDPGGEDLEQEEEESEPITLLKEPLRVYFDGLTYDGRDMRWQRGSTDEHPYRGRILPQARTREDSDGISLCDSDGEDDHDEEEEDEEDRGRRDRNSDLEDLGYNADADDIPLSSRIKKKEEVTGRAAQSPFLSGPTRHGVPPMSVATSGIKRVVPTLISAAPTLRIDRGQTSSSASTYCMAPMLKDLEPADYSASGPSHTSPSRADAPQRTGSISASGGIKKELYLPRAGITLSQIFFKKDGSGLTSDSEDDWYMESSRSPPKPANDGYRMIVQRNMKRVLRQQPVFETSGMTVYAPLRRRAKNVPVKVLKSTRPNAVEVQTSTWDSTFRPRSSLLRVDLSQGMHDTTTINYKALTGGESKEATSGFVPALKDDTILPLYGESDASAYTTDEELMKEVAREEQELKRGTARRARTSARALLPVDTVRDLVVRYRETQSEFWENHTRPKLDRERFKTYQRLTGRSSDVTSAVERVMEKINQVSARLTSIIGAFVETGYRNKEEVRRACKAMDRTLEQDLEYRWQLELVKGPAPPPDLEYDRNSDPEAPSSTQAENKTRTEKSPKQPTEQVSIVSADEEEEERRQRALDDAFIDDSESHMAMELDEEVMDMVSAGDESEAEGYGDLAPRKVRPRPKRRTAGSSPRDKDEQIPLSEANSSLRGEANSDTTEDRLGRAASRSKANQEQDVEMSSSRGPGQDDHEEVLAAGSSLGMSSLSKRNASCGLRKHQVGDDEDGSAEESAVSQKRSRTILSADDAPSGAPGIVSVDGTESIEEPASGGATEDDVSDTESQTMEASPEPENDPPQLSAVIKPMKEPNWRDILKDDDLIARKLREIRKRVRLLDDNSSQPLYELLASFEPYLSAWQEYVEWIELDCGDSISLRDFLRWKDQGNTTAVYRERAKEAAKALEAQARKERKERKDREARERKEKAVARKRSKAEVAKLGKAAKVEQQEGHQSNEVLLETTRTTITIHSDTSDDEKSAKKPRSTLSRRDQVRTTCEKESRSEGTNGDPDSQLTSTKRTRQISEDGGDRGDLDRTEEDYDPDSSTLSLKKRPRVIRNRFDDSVELPSSEDELGEFGKPTSKRRTARPVLNEAEEVLRLRKDEAKNEEELRKRIREQEMRAKFRADTDPLREDEILINPGHKKTERGVTIPSFLASKLKPHQIDGVRFMWKNIVMFDGGCILAHAMGLGKTFQVVAFVYVLLQEIRAGNKDIPKKLQEGRVLLLMPPIVLQNWDDEFRKWIPEGQRSVVDVRRLSNLQKDKSIAARIRVLDDWHTHGGVFLLGYAMFRDMCVKSKERLPEINQRYRELLQEGPSLIIADEGHAIKNANAKLATATKIMKSTARLILTGYPLQNRLEEYWCMVDFIRPNFLGDIVTFRHNYIRPISEGLYPDSTMFDRRVSAKKLRVLSELLKTFVLRKDQSVLRLSLPKKMEFVISCKLSKLQYFLYTSFIQTLDCTSAGVLGNGQILLTICNHPAAFKAALGLHMKEQEKRKADEKEGYHTAAGVDSPALGSKEDPLSVDDSEDVKAGIEAEKALSQNKEVLSNHWSGSFIHDKNVTDVSHGYKVKILMDILRECRALNERVLVFTRSIPTLDYIEHVTTEHGFRSLKLDGDTRIQDRQDMINDFNNSANYDLFLISSGAGSQGVNLVSASRVVIFDVGWNPSHDEQAVARAFRYGQTRKVFVYRLQTYETFEDRLYKTNLHKLGLSTRVVDKKNVVKNSTRTEMKSYFNPPPQIVPRWASEENEEGLFEKPDTEDPVLRKVIASNRDFITWIKLQSELVREEDSDLTEADMVEIQHMIHEEHKRLNTLGQMELPNPPALPLITAPQQLPELQEKPAQTVTEAGTSVVVAKETAPARPSISKEEARHLDADAKQRTAWQEVLKIREGQIGMAQEQLFKEARERMLEREQAGAGALNPVQMPSISPMAAELQQWSPISALITPPKVLFPPGSISGYSVVGRAREGSSSDGSAPERRLFDPTPGTTFEPSGSVREQASGPSAWPASAQVARGSAAGPVFLEPQTRHDKVTMPSRVTMWPARPPMATTQPDHRNYTTARSSPNTNTNANMNASSGGAWSQEASAIGGPSRPIVVSDAAVQKPEISPTSGSSGPAVNSAVDETFQSVLASHFAGLDK